MLRELLQICELAAETREEAKELREALIGLSLVGEAPPAFVDALRLSAASRSEIATPFPTRPDMLGRHGVIVGVEDSSGQPFFWSDHRRSCLIVGSIGSGKTNATLSLVHQLADQGATVWVFDRRHDYLPLLKQLPEAYVIPWQSFRANIMAAPPGVNEVLWFGKLAETFSHVYDLMVGSRSLLEEVLHAVHREVSQNGGTATFIDVCERFASKDYLSNRSQADAQYRGRIHDRLRLLRRKTAAVFGCATGFDLVHLSTCGRVVIFDVCLEDTLRDFLILTLTWYIWCFRNENPGCHTPLILVLDEARHTLRERRNSLEHFVLDIDQLITGSRAFNMGFILAEQIPSQLSPAIINNTELKIAFGCQSQEIKYVANMLGLSKREQSEKLRSLDTGECIVSLAGSRCPVPVLLQTDRFPFGAERMSREEMTAAVERTLAEIGKSVVETVEGETRGSVMDSLGADDIAFLQNVIEEPFATLSERIRAIGAPTGVLYRTLAKMVSEGYVRTQSVRTGAPGRPRKLVELTALGKEVARKHLAGSHISVHEGGILHAFWLGRFRDSLCDAHHVQSGVRLPSGRILDLLVDGSLAIEVEASENITYDAAKYRAILKEIPQLIVAVEEANVSNLLQKLRSAVENGLDEQERGRVRLDHVQTVLKEMS